MQFIIVPFTELLGYLESSLDLWPHGYCLSTDKRERDQQLTKSAGELCKNLILQSVRHIRNKPDPLIQLLSDLGYPVKAMAPHELDELTAQVDDHYIYLTVLFEAVDDQVQSMLEHKSFEMVVKDEDVLINITGDVVTERINALKRRLKERTPPKLVEWSDLDEMAEYIQRTVDGVFQNVSSPPIREELKRLFDLALKRQ